MGLYNTEIISLIQKTTYIVRSSNIGYATGQFSLFLVFQSGRDIKLLVLTWHFVHVLTHPPHSMDNYFAHISRWHTALSGQGLLTVRSHVPLTCIEIRQLPSAYYHHISGKLVLVCFLRCISISAEHLAVYLTLHTKWKTVSREIFFHFSENFR